MIDHRKKLRSNGFKRILLALCVGLFTVWVQPAEAHAACYVAFVHGKHTGTPTVEEVNAYWNPEPTTTMFSFPFWSATAHGCETVLVRWNSTQSFVDEADNVVGQLSTFITQNAIPANELVIVAHSMGGLISRYLLNNALLFPNGDKVLTATKYLITSQTPHLGTKAADAVAFEAGDGLYGATISLVARLLEGRNAASDSMRRVEMEYASAVGGWMNDAFRTKTIYTIEGWRTGAEDGAGPETGLGSQNTSRLALAWGGLCYRPHLINFGQCDWVPGDGLVPAQSASGQFSRSGTWDGTRAADGSVQHYFSNDESLAGCQFAAWPFGLKCRVYTRNTYFPGARQRWLSYGGDHQQGAWDLWPASMHDYLLDTTVQPTTLGTYIGEHGLTLPQ